MFFLLLIKAAPVAFTGITGIINSSFTSVTTHAYLDSSQTPCEVQMYVATETSPISRRVTSTTRMSAVMFPDCIASMIRMRVALVVLSSCSETPTSRKLSESSASFLLSPSSVLLDFPLPVFEH